MTQSQDYREALHLKESVERILFAIRAINQLGKAPHQTIEIFQVIESTLSQQHHLIQRFINKELNQ